MNKLMLVTRGLSDYLYADKEQALDVRGSGVEAFVRNNSKYSSSECIFRIS